MDKISAIVPTYNEEKNIETALKSLSWADEIMVVDAYSTDNTVHLGLLYTSKIFQHSYENSAAQKNWAIPQASHPWVFVLDADEVVTPELQQEIKQVLQRGTNHDAFWIKRKNFFMGKEIKYSGWQDDKVIRLFRRDTCRYQSKNVHAEVETSGTVGRLNHKIEHHSYRKKSLEEHLKRLDIYTTWGAYDREHTVKKVTMFHLLVKPAFRFFKHFILRLGFLDGKVGFIISVLASYTVFLRSLKLWRIQQGEVFSKKVVR